jgi:hypothetical protein
MFTWDRTRRPYPGLPAFEKQDAAVFFGREEEIDHGLDLLNRSRWHGGADIILILGASGSGKSSLLRAGILPRVAWAREDWLVVCPFRPLRQPFDELAKVLADCFRRDAQEQDQKKIYDILRGIPSNGGMLPFLKLIDDLRMSARTREAQGLPIVLLAIDQLEELLSTGQNSEESRFLAMLREVVKAGEGRLMVMGTLRSDFLEAIAKVY